MVQVGQKGNRLYSSSPSLCLFAPSPLSVLIGHQAKRFYCCIRKLSTGSPERNNQQQPPPQFASTLLQVKVANIKSTRQHKKPLNMVQECCECHRCHQSLTSRLGQCGTEFGPRGKEYRDGRRQFASSLLRYDVLVQDYLPYQSWVQESKEHVINQC